MEGDECARLPLWLQVLTKSLNSIMGHRAEADEHNHSILPPYARQEDER